MAEPTDSHWLVLRERGDDVSHVPADVRAPYDALGRLLAVLPGESPSPDWKRRVLRAIDQPTSYDRGSTVRDHEALMPCAARPRARATAIAGGFVALAATVALIVHGTIRPDTAVGSKRAEPVVEVEIRRAELPHRSGGDSVSIGDTLIVRAAVSRPAELRLYGDIGEPLARCAQAVDCSVEHDGAVWRYQLAFALRTQGDVHAVLFTGERLPTAFQGLDVDAEAAQRAGAHAEQFTVICVQ